MDYAAAVQRFNDDEEPPRLAPLPQTGASITDAAKALAGYLTPDYLRAPEPQNPPPDTYAGKVPRAQPLSPLEVAPWLGMDVAGNLAGGIPSGAAKMAMFAGPMARTANNRMLTVAKRMAEKGAPREEIIDATKWFRLRDGKWRFEIRDDAARMRNGVISPQGDTRGEWLPMREAVEHPEAFEAYPPLDSMLFKAGGLRGSLGATMPARNPAYPFRSKVAIDPLKIKDMDLDPMSVILHEMTHPVQMREGFAQGSSPQAVYEEFVNLNPAVRNAIPRDVQEAVLQAHAAGDGRALGKVFGPLYEKVAGEVEARNVQKRFGSYLPTEAERHHAGVRGAISGPQLYNKYPWETQDTPDALQIILGAR